MAFNGKKPSCLCGSCPKCLIRERRRRWRQNNPERNAAIAARYRARQKRRKSNVNLTDAELERQLVNYFVAKGWDDASQIPCR